MNVISVAPLYCYTCESYLDGECYTDPEGEEIANCESYGQSYLEDLKAVPSNSTVIQSTVPKEIIFYGEIY